MSQTRLKDLAVRYQVLLERLKANEIQDFARAFREVGKAIRSILATLDTQNMGELTRRQLNSLLIEFQTENTKILDEAKGNLFATLEPLADYSGNFEEKSLDEMSSKKIVIPASAALYAAVLAQPITATGDFLTDFVDNWVTGEVTRINNVVQNSWGQSSSVAQLLQSLIGTKQLNFQDGVLASGLRNAQTVTRTSIQHVANSARKTVWDDNPDVVKEYVWVSVLDGRTSKICRSLDGQTFKVDQGPLPPAHPNCRSTTRANINDSINTYAGEGAEREGNETYYEWLGNQPAQFQDEALGPTRGKLFRDGGLSADQFAALQLDKNFQPLNLAEMQKLEPSAFAKAKINP